MSTPKKKGRLTNIEQQYIEDNFEHKNYIEIAQHLNRDPMSIKNYIEKLGHKTSLGGNLNVIRDHSITKKHFWSVLSQQFSPPELEMFIYHWDKINEQFDGDILATEEIQILDVIKFEIMMSRNLKQQKDIQDILKNLALKLEEGDPKEKEEAEKQIVIHSTGIAALNKEYQNLQQEKNRLFKDLKATRAARIDKIDSKRESFIHWIQHIINDAEYRKKLGQSIEKRRIAVDLEEVRLMQYHKYEDGKVDRPIFNDKSIELDD